MTSRSIEAAIDIGTNTILMLICEVERPASPQAPSRRIVRVVSDNQTVVRLGQDVHRSRRFADDAMERALKCLHAYKRLCDTHGVGVIRAVATSASRDAANSFEFYGRVSRETGIDVKIIPGETEASLSFLGGLLPFQDPSNVALIDIGGGSTEFVALNRQGPGVHGQSLDMGCVRATELFLKGDPYDRRSVAEMESSLKNLWGRIEPGLQRELREKEWTAIAGTPTTLAALDQGLPFFDAAKIDGYRLDRCSVGDWFEALAIQSQAQREGNPLMGKGRGDIMVAGVGILYTAMEFFDKPDVVVSTRGLRHGIMLNPPQQ